MDLKKIRLALTNYFLRLFAKQIKLSVSIDKKYGYLTIMFQGKMLNCSKDIDYISIKFDNAYKTISKYQHFYIDDKFISNLFFTQFDLSLIDAIRVIVYGD